jgi:hypothetical protein
MARIRASKRQPGEAILTYQRVNQAGQFGPFLGIGNLLKRLLSNLFLAPGGSLKRHF